MNVRLKLQELAKFQFLAMSKNVFAGFFLVTEKKDCSLCVCADIWSDNVNRNSFLDITVILVDQKFEIQTNCVSFCHFSESHTSQNISQKMTEKLADFGIQSDAVPFVTDSAEISKVHLKQPNGIHALHIV